MFLSIQTRVGDCYKDQQGTLLSFILFLSTWQLFFFFPWLNQNKKVYLCTSTLKVQSVAFVLPFYIYRGSRSSSMESRMLLTARCHKSYIQKPLSGHILTVKLPTRITLQLCWGILLDQFQNFLYLSYISASKYVNMRFKKTGIPL